MEIALLGLCGSLRAPSFNAMLLRAAAASYNAPGFVQANLRLPLYDGDEEQATGLPADVVTLASQILAAKAIVIAAPEYNKSLSGVLKNALDWVSRTKSAPWRDKPVAIISAAGGREGGARAQFALRLALIPFRPRLLPGPEVCVANCEAAFDADGRLLDARYQKSLDDLMGALHAESLRS